MTSDQKIKLKYFSRFYSSQKKLKKSPTPTGDTILYFSLPGGVRELKLESCSNSLISKKIIPIILFSFYQ